MSYEQNKEKRILLSSNMISREYLTLAFYSHSIFPMRELMSDKWWLLHNDNASAYNALSIRLFLTERNIAVLEALPGSPDPPQCALYFSPSSMEHQVVRF